jgi:RNA polymerase sigma-70 factor, ECF subfamily
MFTSKQGAQRTSQVGASHIRGDGDMGLDVKTQAAMLKAVPTLRKFAMSLSRSKDLADDLVQETLLRAIAHIDTFQPGSNLDAWLMTILRNRFFSECRERKRTIEDVDGEHAETLATLPEQVGWCIAKDLHEALQKLSPSHRQALILVGESGLSYEEAAVICNCEAGTVKSRVHRARIELASLLSSEKRAQRTASDSHSLRARRAA